MVAFDILYLVDQNICLVASGCDYLSYTFSEARPYYAGQVVVGILFIIAGYFFYLSIKVHSNCFLLQFLFFLLFLLSMALVVYRYSKIFKVDGHQVFLNP